MTMSTQPSTSLATVLTNLGVEVKRVGEREITGKCPVHIRTVGRVDNSPSWSMNATTGLWICFSCGARGSLSSLLYELTGGTDSLGIQKILVESSFEALKAPKLQAEEHVVDRDAFFSFTKVPLSLCESRNLDPDITHKHGVRWNSNHKAWAIPIMSLTGKLEGWQEKKYGSVLNYPNGVKKSKTLFGIERFKSKTAVLVESPLDVVRFAAVGVDAQALGTFGAYVSDEQLRLTLYVADRVVVAMDNDEAGIASSKKIYKTIGTPRAGLLWWNYNNSKSKDIGDMSDEEIKVGLDTATVLPPWIT